MEYSEKYFAWQKRIGEFGGMANLFKFAPYIQPTDRVLDFGCGGGYLLNNIQCAEKMGVDVNESALEVARQEFNLNVTHDLNQIPDGYATVVISNHALEHVGCPLDELMHLRTKMAVGARAVFVVPHQRPNEPYVEGDPNQHLYTWNPLTLGNLFYGAGFRHIEADVIHHAWPPRHLGIYRRFGYRVFDLSARFYSYYKRIVQIRVVGHNPG